MRRHLLIHRLLQAVLVTMAAAVLLGLASRYLPYSLAYNHTASMRQGFYFAERVPFGDLRREDHICFKRVLPSWAQGRKNYGVEGIDLCKQLLGLPGDSIRINANRVEIHTPDGVVAAGEFARADSRGNEMIAAELPAVIPEGFVYAGMPRLALSLDSRYLGLVPAHNISRRVRPLLTW